MPSEKRYDELVDAFAREMQEYVSEGFRASDCFPFVFQNLVETTGIPSADRAELQQRLMDWTKKTM
jgi:hypothetical protein